MSKLSESWRGVRRTGCGCGRCRRCWTEGPQIESLARQSLSAALAHAQHGRFEADDLGEVGRPTREAGPYGTSGPIALPPPPVIEFGPALSLEYLQKYLQKMPAKGPPPTPPQWKGFDKGYYVWWSPVFRRRPLYVGEVRPQGGNTIIGRIRDVMRRRPKHTGSSGNALLSQLLQGEPVRLDDRKVSISAKEIFVQPARAKLPPHSPFRLQYDADHHAIEHLLKVKLDPALARNSLTFEEEHETEEDLRQLDLFVAGAMASGGSTSLAVRHNGGGAS